MASLVLRDAMTDGGITGARARAEELGLNSADLDSFIRRTLWNRIETSPLEVIGWAKQSLGAEAFAEALPRTIKNWARRDFNAAGEWLGQQDPSPSRDAALASYADAVVSINPEAAATWTREIADETERAKVMQKIGTKWKRIDEAAANAWFSAEGISLEEGE